jgi:hypothetical protein
MSANVAILLQCYRIAGKGRLDTIILVLLVIYFRPLEAAIVCEFRIRMDFQS